MFDRRGSRARSGAFLIAVLCKPLWGRQISRRSRVKSPTLQSSLKLTDEAPKPTVFRAHSAAHNKLVTKIHGEVKRWCCEGLEINRPQKARESRYGTG
ncbi:uncharacterized protein K489DRAFT_196534 [Dissoconium aciculare CBS 342.82]|uniref:Secreted protein n=1 Tax=Dissoconium aciculare CBS 342.82 TaxID=1314786 RepID=A0A6J3M5Z3_9PEZI|nr:uncharacterized protein K489DRAFT_196534 [Dissoconium aciculare CBS 342.82]KAF1823455.1 hypothetical protein K489DRAFT_196534 [Dissoconium aciculare CBS 342.82]